MALHHNLISFVMVHNFKPNFVYAFQMNCKLLEIYLIRGSFSLTWLLMMF